MERIRGTVLVCLIVWFGILFGCSSSIHSVPDVHKSKYPWSVKAGGGVRIPDSSGIEAGTSGGATVGYSLSKTQSLELNVNTGYEFTLGEIATDFPQKLGIARTTNVSLTSRYHFQTHSWYRPYVGGGATHTFFSVDERDANLVRLDVDDRAGYVLQAGVDVSGRKIFREVSDRWYVNVDVKRIHSAFDIEAETNSGQTMDDSDPFNAWLITIGVGYRF